VPLRHIDHGSALIPLGGILRASRNEIVIKLQLHIRQFHQFSERGIGIAEAVDCQVNIIDAQLGGNFICQRDIA
jgi:hypothetical protein